MKASECLKKDGDVARWVRDGDFRDLATLSNSGEVTHSREGTILRFCTIDEVDEWLKGDHWQPLYTEAEWEAKHPIAYRDVPPLPNPLQVQFGFGQLAVTAYSDTKGGKRRGLLIQDTGRQNEVGDLVGDPAEQKHEPQPGEIYLDFATRESALIVMEQLARVVAAFASEYELPPLTPEEASEVTPAEQLRAKLNEIFPNDPIPPASDEALASEVQRLANCLAAPAPNSVGERLTREPEVGTPVVRFFDSKKVDFDDIDWSVGRWHNGRTIDLDGCRYYRWHGPIPTEPKEEKVEPPKWLGAVRRNLDGRIVWVAKITGTRCEGLDGNGEAYDLVKADAFTLAPDIMPPSPELAALFAGEGGE